ncbi:protein MODIFIER OF SNC1 1 isoform X2 [Hevea brasiliensis]|uniref:protein MODIFIER OF SNC1 1 isoform X2 n=1 Tax=Hevea brasiliensis TaxID=3981 RepID=UPI0025DE49BF|nr:protein MODIFIER OF SNC1 1 isoform X2 [Hevea brasiliensis]
MTSSMLNGERRWASARRSGMTVLGKVAVPKPINLPSQRLENHGLDPNVEIVPKGTHSWGSRSSSSASNAWGSSSLSPNNDGGTGSPSHLSGRPSSGGSGTRPSTAGSDKANEPIVNAWGSNSRPSSSSGALPSNQTSHGALRPRSAETRPGSSQLSRFAEHLSDNSVAWHAMGTADKLGVTSSKNDGFSLTSGDFPTLGSEKDNSGKNADSQGSSSASVTSRKEGTGDSAGDVSVHANVKSGADGPWRRENSLYGEDVARTNVEKWYTDHQPYPNSSIPPQHYDSWHGPPVNNHPGGVWCRGPPGGPPFGSPVAPSGFPMEPFPYYRPQIPPPALANPQPVPPPGAAPRGPHPKNGDMYRPHLHDAYMRPIVPLRPSFYPGPVPCEGYYGPPMGYCNPNERDVPFMGMAMGPAAYNRYHGQNIPDPGNSHGRTSGYGLSSKAMVLDQVEPVHPQDIRGPYKVLLKQHDGWEGRDEEQKFDDTMKTNASYPLKGEHTRKSSWENDWRADNRKDHELEARRMAVIEESSSEAVDNQGVVPMKVKSPESMGKLNASYDNSVKKFEDAASNVPQVLATPKDSSLIQKIEGLNAKTRASDGRQDVKPVSSVEEQKNKFQVGNVFTGCSTNEAVVGSLSYEKTCVSGIINSAPHEDCFSAGVRSLESTIVSGSGTAIPRRSSHGMHGRADHRGKGRFNTQEADGWRKKSQVADPQSIVSTVHCEISSVNGQDHNSAEATQNSVMHPSVKDDGESMAPNFEPSDSQRAKMRELAKRIKQREKEEEERTREQRAKARAKLEELNRRTQAGEGVTQKLENVPAISIQNRQEESLNLAQPTITTSKSGAPSSSFDYNPNTVAQSREKLETLPSGVVQNRHEVAATAGPPIVVSSKSRASSSASGSSPSMAVHGEISMNTVDKSISMASNVPLETPKIVNNESVGVHEQLKPFQPESNNADAAHSSSAPRVNDSGASKQKRTGNRQKQNSPLEKISNEKLSSSFGTEASKGHTDMVENVADEIDLNCELNLPSIAAESSVHHRRKNRNGKNRHKMEAALSAAVLPSVISKDTTTLDTLVESVKAKSSESKISESILDPSAVCSPTDANDANQSSELRSSLTNEETHIRVNNQWRSQHPRRMPRNPQSNKSAEKNHSGDAVVWAPVRSQHKTEVSDEANQNSLVESVLSTKSDQQVQNNPRNKRAEMERYIPKHVAKELSQQGGSHQAVVPSSNEITSYETAERPESGSLGIESSQTYGTATVMFSAAMESRNGDVGQNKLGKVHGAWRQRGAAESTTSNLSRSFQKSIEDHQQQKPDVCSTKEQPRNSDEWNDSDGWNMPENPDTASTVPVLKEQGVTARVKRQPHKGHKGTGYNHNPDEKRTRGDADKMYIQSVVSEIHQIDLSVASKENHSAGERSTSQWQPKSQPISATSQRGSRITNSLNEGSEGGRAIKESTQHGEPLLPQPDKDAAAVRPQSHHGQSPSEKNNLEEAPAVGHQEPKRERKIAAQRGRPGSPVESSSPNMDIRHDKRMSSGFRKNGNQNSRFSRDHESRGDRSGSGKDSKQHNVHAVRERDRHNSHYEYHPVGPHNSGKANNLEVPKDVSHNYSGTGYRERGQGHSRHGAGNFYGRQTGSVQVDAGHD